MNIDFLTWKIGFRELKDVESWKCENFLITLGTSRKQIHQRYIIINGLIFNLDSYNF